MDTSSVREVQRRLRERYMTYGFRLMYAKDSSMNEPLTVLQSSVHHLCRTVEDFSPEQLTASAYPSEWTVADVLSHLGSAAVIMRRRAELAVTGGEMDEAFAPSVWDEWNAKMPAAQAADLVVADRALTEHLASLTPTDRASFHFAMGPIELGFDGFVRMRLAEHAIHVWDIEVAFDRSATIGSEAAGVVIDGLAVVAQYSGKPTGGTQQATIHTTDPARDIRLVLGPGQVLLDAGSATATPDLELPAEAFIRLVYGRLDADHTPTLSGTADLEVLRAVFPGV